MTQFYDIVLYFFIFSFIGWIIESLYCSALAKPPQWINRGFLNGPICPIYGCGGLIAVYILLPYRENIALIFIASMVLNGVLEYTTGYLLEKIFHAKWWDYSHHRFNLHGRVSLWNLLLFGVMSVVGVWGIYPMVSTMIYSIPPTSLPYLAWALLALLILDASVSVRAIVDLNAKLEEMKARMDAFRERSYQVLGEAKNEHFSHLLEPYSAERLEADLETLAKKLGHAVSPLTGAMGQVRRRLLRAFPGMRSSNYAEQLERMRTHWNRRRGKIEKDQTAANNEEKNN